MTKISQFALSLKQPWAELILQGKKTVETRTWNTEFRGSFYIHASKQIDKEACDFFGINSDSLQTGCIVGQANLSEVKEYLSKDVFLADGLKHRANLCLSERESSGRSFLLVSHNRRGH